MRGSSLLLIALLGCSANKDEGAPSTGLSDGSVTGDSSGDGSSFDVDPIGDVTMMETSSVIPDPTTCAEAAAGHTYVGCDFWPTVTDNIVRPDFDYAVVVANTSSSEATVEVTRGGMSVSKTTVPANGLSKIYLPWVEALKSTMPNNGCPTNVKLATVRAVGGAYHLTSSIPVAVYQFNAIEYAGKGGPPGKDWGGCTSNTCFGLLAGKCFSYTNDASLLLPSTALTGNYRVAGVPPWGDSTGMSTFVYPPYVAITGTQAGTNVTVKLSSIAATTAGPGVAAAGAGGTVSFTIGAGDVVELIATDKGDLSGSLIKASAPIQVVSGISCTNVPADQVACDHVEESLLPVETLGRHYFVTRPTAPSGSGASEHVVKLVGNVDGTKLTYPGTKPPGAPDTIDAGELVELGKVGVDFEIVGDHELTIMSLMVGAGPTTSVQKGDPSQSFMTSVEQYRLKYVFLAPDDYDVNYVDVVQPMDAALTLDGKAVTDKPTAMSSGFGVNRIKLGPGTSGAHVLSADKQVGIQVLGYGSYTSYQYPGGLNLGRIAPPPIK
jgi:hypothetical protein